MIGNFFLLYFYMTLEELYYSKIGANVGRAIVGRNFDVTNGRAACEANSATWNLVQTQRLL
jgi:hypothetical protein